ncbi:MAG: T9SS type A sorting domain-containing protein [Paludibacteraceae bacterium]|nr:T9SS type A sorting domain-containing protein [Paludibacteraceae bacterium]
MRRLFYTNILLLIFSLTVLAQTHILFDDTQNWTTAQLQQYVGQTVIFDQPVYICNNYRGVMTASLHRQMSPTNQALPLSAEYNQLVSAQSTETFTLTGFNAGSDRMGQVIYGLHATITARNQVAYISSERIYGTRADIESGIPDVDMVIEDDTIVQHDLLVCAANLEYYLVQNLGTGYGPDDVASHQRQRQKVSKAMAKINADIYGFVEVEQGQAALAEIAQDLTANTGRHFSYIDDGGRASGSYTKSGYVYCDQVVTPYGTLRENNTGVNNRKKMQAFDVIASGERFIFSINHFKAKSGTASGLDADQHDGQGTFNYARTTEAKSVVRAYQDNSSFYSDNDILIMGDLNAYAKEDPIQEFIRSGMTDLHRHFHADSSYSYTFHGQAGYLDHAICNSTMLAQVTGMAAYHVNSDESDDYTYDKSSDISMFRYSDHDPILVGLKMGASLHFSSNEEVDINNVKMSYSDGTITIKNSISNQSPYAHYAIYTLDGRLLSDGHILSEQFNIDCWLPSGIYIINVYAGNNVLREKILVR